jgi:uncharacterized protein YndB with AHSA1/START domain
MKAFDVETVIAAETSEVWRALSDINAWPSWDSGVLRVEGKAVEGNKIKLVSEADPKRAFTLKVARVTPETGIVLTGGMPLGLFKGVRTYSLSPQQGGTRFRMREEYSGPFAPMIVKSIPDLQPTFDKFAAGLKARAEARR